MWPQVMAQTRGIYVAFVGNMGHRHQTDLGYGKSIDPDVVLGSGPGPDATIVLAGSAGHLNQHAHHSSMAIGHPQGLRCQLNPWHGD